MKSLYLSAIALNEKQNGLDGYLNDLGIVQYLKEQQLCFEKPVTILIGENGTGKSTLLEAIAVAYGFNAEGGTRNLRFSTHETHSNLYESLTLIRHNYAEDGFFLRAESLYNVASGIDETGVVKYYGGISLHEQSHGESFLSIVQNRFSGHGLYILDEPEAALSPMHLLTLMVEIDRLVKENSQFIIATHSPMLMAFPNAQVLQLSRQGIEAIDYRQSEHFLTMKAFLDDPERMLHYLLDSDH